MLAWNMSEFKCKSAMKVTTDPIRMLDYIPEDRDLYIVSNSLRRWNFNI